MYKFMPDDERMRLRGQDLRGRNFDNFDLTDTDFSYSDCRGCSFRDSMLAWSNMQHADLSDAGFQNSFLNEVDLRGAILKGANFAGASLQPVYASLAQFTESRGLDSASWDMHGQG